MWNYSRVLQNMQKNKKEKGAKVPWNKWDSPIGYSLATEDGPDLSLLSNGKQKG